MNIKHSLKIITLLVIQSVASLAQQADAFVQSMNTQWAAKNYEALSSTVEAALQQRPDDLTVLYAATNFYLMVKPDLAKLTATANKIKAIAATANKPAITAISDDIQTYLPGLSTEGLGTPTATQLDELHKRFNSEFPLISVGVRLQSLRM